jgi:hypothetical protein
MGEDLEPLEELCARWWEFLRLSQGDRAQRKALELGEPREAYAAAAIVAERIQTGGSDAIRLVIALIETAPDDAGIAVVGAGPLEDLVHEHGDSLIDELDRVARRNPAFSHAMGSVWLSAGVLNPDVEHRLRMWMPG